MLGNPILLPDEIVSIIQEVVLEIKDKYNIQGIIREGIFDLLEKECTVIYYPLKNEKNRGFHIRKLVKDHLEDFVYINTDKTVEQQVFTATHELGHIFRVYDMVIEKAKKSGIQLDKGNLDYEEKVTDRFAAEFLMPEPDFIKSTKEYAEVNQLNGTISIGEMLKLIARLMDEYLAPFNAVRKRLHEIKAIDETANRYLSENKVKLEGLIDFLKKDDNSVMNTSTGVKTISGLRELVENASEKPNVNAQLIDVIRKDFDLEKLDLLDDISIKFTGVTNW